VNAAGVEGLLLSVLKSRDVLGLGVALAAGKSPDFHCRGYFTDLSKLKRYTPSVRITLIFKGSYSVKMARWIY
jgi:hypothetical protein